MKRGKAHGVNREIYVRENELLGEIGQRNTFSGSFGMDVSCFIFKEFEKKRLGITLI